MIRIRNRKRTRGAALVEYGLLVAGVTVVSAAALSIFGHKTSDLLGLGASILPGAHADDNGAIVSPKIIETTDNGGNGITIDASAAAAGGNRLGDNVVGAANNAGNTVGATLVLEAN